MKIKLACSYNISFVDYPDLEEWSTVLYTLGCPHNCKGCHNRALKDPNYEEYDEYSIEELLNFMSVLSEKSQSYNFTIIGGEPLAPWNIDAIKALLEANTEFNICIYTGYDVKYVIDNDVKGFSYIKTGGYDESKLTGEVPHGVFSLASTNQQIWDSNMNLVSKDGIFIKN